MKFLKDLSIEQLEDYLKKCLFIIDNSEDIAKINEYIKYVEAIRYELFKRGLTIEQTLAIRYEG